MSPPGPRPLDISALFAVLAEHRVDYVVVGGVAVQVHGHRRTTRDLDLVPSPEPENLVRLAAALAALDAAPVAIPGAPAPTADQLGAAPVAPPLDTRHGELHILNEVPGARPFHRLRRDALELSLDDVTIPVVSLDDLVSMKRASGRPEDLADLAVLLGSE